MIRSTRIVYTLYRSRFLKTIKFFTRTIYINLDIKYLSSRDLKENFFPLPSSPLLLSLLSTVDVNMYTGIHMHKKVSKYIFT